MTDQIGHYLLEIVKAGGPLAIWGVTIWLVFKVLGIFLVMLFLYLGVKVVCQCISNNYKVDKELSAQQVHLLSQEVSGRMEQALDSFSKDCLTAVRELKVLLEGLKKPSKKT